jgi:alginate O-acetyltransferase complex protein AlgJ
MGQKCRADHDGGLASLRLGRRGALALPAILLAGRAQAQDATAALAGRDGWVFPPWDIYHRHDAVQVRESQGLMIEAANVMRAARIELVLCMIPTKGRLYREQLPASARMMPEVARRYATAVADLRRAGVTVADLDTRFRQSIQQQPGQLLFFKTDTHWTPYAAEIAAAEVAREMRERIRLPPANRPGMRLGAPRTLSLAQGDLVRMLPADQRGAYRGEEVPIRQAVPPEGPAALIEDESHDVVVVGTSNMQPRFGFQPALSAALDRPVGLHWRVNNFGIWSTTVQYVQGDLFRRYRPKVIVWQPLEGDLTVPPSSTAWGQNRMTPQAFIAGLRQGLGV